MLALGETANAAAAHGCKAGAMLAPARVMRHAGRSMGKAGTRKAKRGAVGQLAGYDDVLSDVAQVIEAGRRAAARSVNTAMTTSYWFIGRRIVEAEQAGASRADYGKMIVDHLANDLTTRFGRGFGRRNVFQMRAFYLAYREILQTPSALSESDAAIVQTLSAQFDSETAKAVAS